MRVPTQPKERRCPCERLFLRRKEKHSGVRSESYAAIGVANIPQDRNRAARPALARAESRPSSTLARRTSYSTRLHRRCRATRRPSASAARQIPKAERGRSTCARAPKSQPERNAGSGCRENRCAASARAQALMRQALGSACWTAQREVQDRILNGALWR